jgi:hypothetical protein
LAKPPVGAVSKSPLLSRPEHKGITNRTKFGTSLAADLTPVKIM